MATNKVNRDMTVSELFPKDRPASNKRKVEYMSNSQIDDEGFVAKWSQEPCEILLINEPSNGKYYSPQARINDMLLAFRLIPDNVKAILVIEAGENGWDYAEKIYNGHPDTFILCDMSDHFKDAVLPSNTFKGGDDYGFLDIDAQILQFADGYDLVPENVRKTFQIEQILSAEVISVDSVSTSLYSRKDNDPESRTEEISALFRKMSLGKLTLPKREDYGIPTETPKYDIGTDISLMSTIIYSVPLEPNQQEYVAKLTRVKDKMEDVMGLWDLAMRNTPFDCKPSRIMADKYSESLIAEAADVFGVTKKISALLDHGISFHDLTTGEI